MPVSDLVPNYFERKMGRKQPEGSGGMRIEGEWNLRSSLYLVPLSSGISLEGTVLVDRSDANSKAYGRNCTAKQILSGSIQAPMFAQPLVSTIEKITYSGTEFNGERESDDFNQDQEGYIGRKAEVEDFGPGSPSRRDSTTYFEKSDALSQEESWTASQRRRRDENETRNLGSYAFGSPRANGTNSPAQATSYSSSKDKSKATDYFSEDPFTSNGDSSPSKSRPKGNRSASSGSFSFLRSSNKSPVNSKKPPSPVASKAPVASPSTRAAYFPTSFYAASSSEEEDNINRKASRAAEDYDSIGFHREGATRESSLDSWSETQDLKGGRNRGPDRDIDTTPRPFSLYSDGNGPGVGGGGRKLSTFDGMDSLDKELQGMSTSSRKSEPPSLTMNKSHAGKAANGNSNNWRSMSYGGSSAFGYTQEPEEESQHSIGVRNRALSGNTKVDPFATLYDDELSSRRTESSKNDDGWGSGRLRGYRRVVRRVPCQDHNNAPLL